MKCTLKLLRPAFSGQRLQTPFSPGLELSKLSSPLASRRIISNQGAPTWFGENITRLPKCGVRCGQATLPVNGSNMIGCRLPGWVDFYLGLSVVLSFSLIARLPSQAQSNTVASEDTSLPLSSSLWPGLPIVGICIVPPSLT